MTEARNEFLDNSRILKLMIPIHDFPSQLLIQRDNASEKAERTLNKTSRVGKIITCVMLRNGFMLLNHYNPRNSLDLRILIPTLQRQ